MGQWASALEGVVMVRNPDAKFWRDKRVFLTGHTGFKGAWLALWLKKLGAEVYGFSLEPPSSPNLFDLARVQNDMVADVRADLRDSGLVATALTDANPHIVLHLAAQSLVRPSYDDPLGTFATNVMGTAHVLEAARRCASVRAVVIVTTDKCYENQEWVYPYREVDRLGGHDPYSASKACAELVTACWRQSFPGMDGMSAPHIASARAGNVIGAGDWANDRLLPDCSRAFSQGNPVRLRYPHAVRPWQHVLEPLAGYLLLAESLCSEKGSDFAQAWNFGPDANSDAPVGKVAQDVAAFWGQGARVEIENSPKNPHEAGLLRLDSTLARLRLEWRPRWPLARALSETVSGYKLHAEGGDLRALVLAQIDAYLATSDQAG